MSSQSLPFLDFLVSSVQFSGNNKVTTTQSLAFDAPSKLDNAKHKLRCTDLRFMSFALSLILRKEVIQPHLPIRLPCYDFTPVTFPTLDGLAGFGCE